MKAKSGRSPPYLGDALLSTQSCSPAFSLCEYHSEKDPTSENLSENPSVEGVSLQVPPIKTTFWNTLLHGCSDVWSCRCSCCWSFDPTETHERFMLVELEAES